MKRIITIILAMSAVLSLTACGEKNSQTQSTPTSQTTSKPNSQPTSETESSVTSAPESTVTSTPESSVTSAPESSVTSAPESTVTSTPESTVTSAPESTVTSAPESTVTSDHESSTEIKTESKPEEKPVLPLKEYPAGSYFTNDGKPCTDHDTCDWDRPCNCVNFDRSIQSVGFARYVYFKVTGKHVYEAAKTEINADINEQTARANLKGLPCGTYIAAIGSNDRPHTMAVISTNDNGITVYQANYGGKCVVSAPTYSWKEFAARFPHIEYYAK